MVDWSSFTLFGIVSMILWMIGALISFKYRRLGGGLYGLGVLTFALFIGLFWFSMGRAPLRTMGETRLWYSFFLSVVTLLLFWRWHFVYLLPFGAILSSVFTLVNILKPEIHDATLMPALQSVWFIPHVTIYMLSYALLAIALLVAIVSLIRDVKLMGYVDQLVRIGMSLLLLGMLMGAVWAKQAWGTYWSWDVKENWALVTWFFYLCYVHLRYRSPAKIKLCFVFLLLGFLALQVTWYGVNYLPAAKQSMHTYMMTTN